jgi:small-conductance mechanosensitive channel
MTIKLIILVAIIVVSNLVIAYLKNQTKFRSSLHGKYLLQIVRLIIFVLCLSEMLEVIDPELNMRSILLRGSALVVAILGFAAQPVISAVMSGLLISIHKPFEIGDRVIIDGAATGVVEDITLRHTVIAIYDGFRVIIPNSELNSRVVTNTSYQMKDRRGIHLSYSVSYETDVQKAMDVIRDCVAASPYTLSVENNGIHEDSSPVYFFKFDSSALILETTIWVARETDGCKAITDVNTRVLNAFRRYGIEIPYQYVNVNQFEGSKVTPPVETTIPEKVATPAKRHIRTNTVHMIPGEDGLEDAIQTARGYAKRQNLEKRAAMQLELLTEESLGFVQRVVDHTSRDFWIEGTGEIYRIHLRFDAKVGSEAYKKLIMLSSTGRNEAANSITGKVWEAVLMGLKRPPEKGNKGKSNFVWQLSEAGVDEEEIGKSILGAVASDVRVSVTTERVELIISKMLD